MLTFFKRLSAILPRSARTRMLVYVPVSILLGLSELAGMALLVPLLGRLTHGTELWGSAYVQRLEQWFGAYDRQQLLWLLGGGLLVCLVLRELAFWVLTYARSRFMQQVERELSTRLLQAYLDRPYSFYLEQHTSDLKLNTTSRLTTLVRGVLEPLANATSGSALTVILGAAFVWVEPWLALACAVLGLGLTLGISGAMRGPIGALSRRVFTLGTRMARDLQELFQGIKDVKFASMEQYWLDRYRLRSDAMALLLLRYRLLCILPGRLGESLLLLAGVGAVLFLTAGGGAQLASPRLSLLVLVAARLLPVVRTVLSALLLVQSQQVVVDEIYTLLSNPIAASPSAGPLKLEKGLAFRDVRFAYRPESSPALDGVTFSLDAGTWLAVVGRTGAGKTTLVDLLLGLLQPQSGSIVVDEQPLQAGWSAGTGYVAQKQHIFEATLGENISLGSELDRERATAACRLACLEDFVVPGELGDGLDTVLGEGGRGLSQGQAQRVGLARAIYRQPQLLVLDEATSHLDPATEHQVLANLRGLGCTVLMVTHRLAATRHCDSILVLDRGRVVARDTEAALWESCAEWRQLCGDQGRPGTA